MRYHVDFDTGHFALTPGHSARRVNLSTCPDGCAHQHIHVFTDDELRARDRAKYAAGFEAGIDAAEWAAHFP